ncbi:MAG: hypothetical protein D6E12_17000 [Desulfovibrio sp.]|nr:MAG: hypothetical protein D6E12_17000 [Desulfovibrio sp.]
MGLIALLGAAGCNSQIPQPVTYPVTTQHKMQAAEHWNILAEETAERVVKAVGDRDDLQGRAIHIDLPNRSAFAVAFHDLLTSHLVSRAMQISVEQEDSLVLTYHVSRVTHHWRFNRPPPGLLTSIGVGITVLHELEKVGETWSYVALSAAGLIADVAVGHYTWPSDTEIIITVELTENNRYVLHTSSIYYINDPDVAHYGASSVGATPLRVVND